MATVCYQPHHLRPPNGGYNQWASGAGGQKNKRPRCHYCDKFGHTSDAGWERPGFIRVVAGGSTLLPAGSVLALGGQPTSGPPKKKKTSWGNNQEEDVAGPLTLSATPIKFRIRLQAGTKVTGLIRVVSIGSSLLPHGSVIALGAPTSTHKVTKKRKPKKRKPKKKKARGGNNQRAAAAAEEAVAALNGMTLGG
ncbi:hypothetical protein FDECE_3176 [Fusarium decemcellulare]|nr:hypothetical protein FDECE_3176 [Fusarium decemcellulare]